MSYGVKHSYTQPDNTSQMNCSAKFARTSVFEIHNFGLSWVRVDGGSQYEMVSFQKVGALEVEKKTISYWSSHANDWRKRRLQGH